MSSPEHFDATQDFCPTCGLTYRACECSIGATRSVTHMVIEHGVGLIDAERARQITEKGYTPENDDRHQHEELVMAAICYAFPPNSKEALEAREQLWPWAPVFYNPTPQDRVWELTRAGALIAAEIDRLIRLRMEDPAATTHGDSAITMLNGQRIDREEAR